MSGTWVVGPRPNAFSHFYVVPEGPAWLAPVAVAVTSSICFLTNAWVRLQGWQFAKWWYYDILLLFWRLSVLCWLKGWQHRALIHMPVLKEDGQDGLEKEWLLRVLDSRFRQQEQAIQFLGWNICSHVIFLLFSTYQTYFHFPKAIFTSGNSLPVVPHKAVAEVSKIDNYSNYRRGELLWCMDVSANPLMDRKVVGVVLFGVVAVVNSSTTAECSVAWFGVA